MTLNEYFACCRVCWEKFGWSSQKADELLVPVLKEYNKHEVGPFFIFFYLSYSNRVSCY